MVQYTDIGDVSSAEVDRMRGVYVPLAESVRALIDATIRTEVDADAAPTVRPAAVDTRESVTTTPPALPSPSNLPDGIRAGSSAGREAPPTAMTPPVPPSPAAPVV